MNVRLTLLRFSGVLKGKECHKNGLTSLIFSVLLLSSFASLTQDNPDIFPPPEVPPLVQAVKATGEINIDGILDEASWAKAIPDMDFIQRDPVRGNPGTRYTEAKVLFDGTNLYIGAFCKTKNGRREILVQNLQRDFDYFQNDMFGAVLDARQAERRFVPNQTLRRATGALGNGR